MKLRFAPVWTALVLAGGMAVPPAQAAVQPYGAGQGGQFLNILPPGQNGFGNLAQLGQFRAGGAGPAHSRDQLAMYHDLTTAAPNIAAGSLGNFFKDATFGVRTGDVASSESPEPGATIIRDSGYGIPHIYGDTRPELEFAIGWATAEDRLFQLDVLRHAGAGNLSGFAGGGNVSMDAASWANEPYTPADLQAQTSYLASLPGGAQLLSDARNYVEGINAYVAKVTSNPVNQALLLPAEYAAIGQPNGPTPFTVQDIVSTASLIGGQLGQGGGQQLRRAVLYETLTKRLGPERRFVPGAPAVVPLRRGRRRAPGDHSGFGTFGDFVAANDPEAPTTVTGRRFPYQTLPTQRKLRRASIALPDPGSVQYVNDIAARSGGARDVPGGGAATTGAETLNPALGRAHAEIAAIGRALLQPFPTHESNALLLSSRLSANHQPIAVIGPQVAYFSPQILMEQDIHGPGIDARGVSFPGTNLVVELGHGTNYAWSATSEGQNIIDTFAVPLCVPGGGRVPSTSNYYVLGHSCVKMVALTESESWTPSLADSTPAGSVTLRTFRTAFGLVIARATVRGRPVVYTNLRSTYMHELDSALGFEAFNDPAKMQNPAQFMSNAYKIGYTFNWFFINPRHIAYLGSGANPVRAAGTDPMFPSWSAYVWPSYRPAPELTPAGTRVTQTPQAAHPHVTDQAFITSWNNKPAPGYNYPDGDYSSIFRSQLLDLNIRHYLRATHNRMTLTDLVNAMGNAGTQDLRGVEVLPYALKVLGRPRDPSLAAVVRQLRAWVASGAHRINRSAPAPSGSYDQSEAVRVMDAWWPLLVSAIFTPALGADGLTAVESNFTVNDSPHRHLGSAWDTGFYGVVQKDLRSVLHLPEAGRLSRIYCGSGALAACRRALRASLARAAATAPADVYPAGGGCAAGDQMCYDAIHYTAIGAFTTPNQEWVNRPTFQQTITFGANG